AAIFSGGSAACGRARCRRRPHPRASPRTGSWVRARSWRPPDRVGGRRLVRVRAERYLVAIERLDFAAAPQQEADGMAPPGGAEVHGATPSTVFATGEAALSKTPLFSGHFGGAIAAL